MHATLRIRVLLIQKPVAMDGDNMMDATEDGNTEDGNTEDGNTEDGNNGNTAEDGINGWMKSFDITIFDEPKYTRSINNRITRANQHHDRDKVKCNDGIPFRIYELTDKKGIQEPFRILQAMDMRQNTQTHHIPGWTLDSMECKFFDQHRYSSKEIPFHQIVDPVPDTAFEEGWCDLGCAQGPEWLLFWHDERNKMCMKRDVIIMVSAGEEQLERAQSISDSLVEHLSRPTSTEILDGSFEMTLVLSSGENTLNVLSKFHASQMNAWIEGEDKETVRRLFTDNFPRQKWAFRSNNTARVTKLEYWIQDFVRPELGEKWSVRFVDLAKQMLSVGARPEMMPEPLRTYMHNLNVEEMAAVKKTIPLLQQAVDNATSEAERLERKRELSTANLQLHFRTSSIGRVPKIVRLTDQQTHQLFTCFYANEVRLDANPYCDLIMRAYWLRGSFARYRAPYTKPTKPRKQRSRNSKRKLEERKEQRNKSVDPKPSRKQGIAL